MVLLKLKIDRVEIEFAAVDQHELAWAERGDLAHQLASDRSPGACHQHPPAMDRLAHHFAVEHRLRAAQKLGHVDVAQIQFAHPAVLELGELRQACDLQSKAFRLGDEDRKSTRL